MSDLVSLPPRQRKAQITCTAIFIVWGVLVHLVIPPFVFMVTEEWDYIEGLYYSFITISTIGFGDFVAGESCPLPSRLPPPFSFSAPSVSVHLPWEPPLGSQCPGYFPHPEGSLPHLARQEETKAHGHCRGLAHFPFLGLVPSLFSPTS